MMLGFEPALQGTPVAEEEMLPFGSELEPAPWRVRVPGTSAYVYAK
jgi:hypothetical protein